METTRSIAAAMLSGDWAASLDLRDAYLHVLVHPDYQHYLRFYFEGRVYQFKAMPFGLATARRIFQSIVEAFVAPLQALDSLPGLHIHRDSLLHPCGTNVPPSGQDRKDNVQSQTTVRSKVLSGKGIFMSPWPTKLSCRSSPTRKVVPSTSSTSQEREIPLPESLLREVWKFWDSEISIRGCCFIHPLPNSPCSQTRPISVGELM
jgi:hypothetical protein